MCALKISYELPFHTAFTGNPSLRNAFEQGLLISGTSGTNDLRLCLIYVKLWQLMCIALPLWATSTLTAMTLRLSTDAPQTNDIHYDTRFIDCSFNFSSGNTKLFSMDIASPVLLVNDRDNDACFHSFGASVIHEVNCDRITIQPDMSSMQLAMNSYIENNNALNYFQYKENFAKIKLHEELCSLSSKPYHIYTDFPWYLYPLKIVMASLEYLIKWQHPNIRLNFLSSPTQNPLSEAQSAAFSMLRKEDQTKANLQELKMLDPRDAYIEAFKAQPDRTFTALREIAEESDAASIATLRFINAITQYFSGIDVQEQNVLKQGDSRFSSIQEVSVIHQKTADILSQYSECMTKNEVLGITDSHACEILALS